jgi:UDP-N-acetylmuramate--alanine ligase
VKAENVYEGIKGHGHKDITLAPDKNKVLDQLIPRLKPGDIVITLGAGDVWKIGDSLIQELKKGHET